MLRLLRLVICQTRFVSAAAFSATEKSISLSSTIEWTGGDDVQKMFVILIISIVMRRSATVFRFGAFSSRDVQCRTGRRISAGARNGRHLCQRYFQVMNDLASFAAKSATAVQRSATRTSPTTAARIMKFAFTGGGLM